MPIVQVGGTIQPCYVTGNIATLSGGAIPQGIIIFQLYNIGTGTIPQLLGIAELPNSQFPVMTDQTGATHSHQPAMKPSRKAVFPLSVFIVRLSPRV